MAGESRARHLAIASRPHSSALVEFGSKQKIADELRWQRQVDERRGADVSTTALKYRHATQRLEVQTRLGHLVHLNDMRRGTTHRAPRWQPLPASHAVHHHRQSPPARAHHRLVVDGAAVLRARASPVLDAVQSGGRVAVEHVDAGGDRAVPAQGLAFAARAERVEEGCDEEAAVAGVAEVLEVRVEGLAGVGGVRVGCQRSPAGRIDHTHGVRLQQPHMQSNLSLIYSHFYSSVLVCI